MNRREFLHSSTALTAASLLGGCSHKPMTSSQASARLSAPPLPFYDAVPPLAPIRAHEDRLYRITVCLRPFRATGPRIETELIGAQRIVHNYGHGGSGWSLSWGSGTLAVQQALAGTDPSTQEIAVLGCGALGLTSALLLQRAGCRVTIYARDRTTDTRSFRATGSWTPDSRVALTRSMSASFPAMWEQMARTSWRTYQGFLGLPGAPIEFTDRYALSDIAPEADVQRRLDEDPIGFAHLRDRILDITPRALDLPPGSHPFPTRYARRNSQLMFNITDLVHQLTEDFLINGGKIQHADLHTPADLASLPQRTVINCTGYGARALFNDNSITPVRGQIGWLIPQPECNYGITDGTLNVLARPDGIVVQLSEKGEATGFNDTNEEPDRGEAERGVAQLRALYDHMHPARTG